MTQRYHKDVPFDVLIFSQKYGRRMSSEKHLNFVHLKGTSQKRYTYILTEAYNRKV